MHGGFAALYSHPSLLLSIRQADCKQALSSTDVTGLRVAGRCILSFLHNVLRCAKCHGSYRCLLYIAKSVKLFAEFGVLFLLLKLLIA